MAERGEPEARSTELREPSEEHRLRSAMRTPRHQPRPARPPPRGCRPPARGPYRQRTVDPYDPPISRACLAGKHALRRPLAPQESCDEPVTTRWPDRESVV